MRHVLAVDGGNSKTIALVASETGWIASFVRGGGCNYQGIGRAAAALTLGGLVHDALDSAGLAKVDAACYGLAGADRDKDFAVFREILEGFDPAPPGMSALVNDTLLALRAGTKDGVGVALIGGAGSNCIGMNKAGEIAKAWGLGPMTGDKANAYSLVLDAIVAAMKGIDGRGPQTALEDKFKKALGLGDLLDVIEHEFHDSPRELGLGELAPLVFEAADEGDPMALNILAEHGQAAAEAARAVLRKLFPEKGKAVLALGGSVYQKGSNPALVEALRDQVQMDFPEAEMTVLAEPPVLGAALLALDKLFGETAPAEVADTLKRNIAKAIS